MQEEVLRFIAINDPHHAARNPGSWKIDYRTELNNSLEQVFRYGKKIGVTAYVYAGDIFHLKSKLNNPHWLVTEVAQMMRAQGVPILGIAGNHDMTQGSLAGLKGQPLEVLIETGVYHLLDREDRLFWLPMKDGKKPICVQVSGRSYNHGRADEAIAVKKRTADGVDYLITVAHFWFGPQSGNMFGEPITGPDQLSKGESDVYVIGHHHEAQGATEIKGKWYVSQGSITRVGAHKNDLERRPAAALIEISHQGISVRLLHPKVTDSSLAFDLETRKRIMKENEEMDAFTSSMSKTTNESLDPVEILRTTTEDQKVRERAECYIREAEAALLQANGS